MCDWWDVMANDNNSIINRVPESAPIVNFITVFRIELNHVDDKLKVRWFLISLAQFSTPCFSISNICIKRVYEDVYQTRLQMVS